MKFGISTVLAASALVAASAQAGCGGNACTDVKVTLVYTNGYDSTWLSTSGDESALSCTASSNLLQITPTVSKADWLFSTVLSAYYSGAPINVRLNDSGPCVVAYVFVGTQ